MSETRAHRRAKTRAAGLGGRTEVPLPRGQRLDALTKGKGRATEVERSGSATGLRAAARAFSRYIELWPVGRRRQGLLRVGKLGARASRPPLQTHRESLKML